MMSHDEKIPIRAGFFEDDSEILQEQTQKEVAEKQGYYENQIQKLYERIQSLAHKGTTDLNLLWAKTREFVNFCNKAGEYFLKVQLFELAKGKFIVAKKSLEKFSANDIQSTSEWKALKISVYKNLAQYYSKLNQSEKSLDLLKKILPLQQELQKNEILLPGAEFLYISMGDLAHKLKSNQEAVNYAELGIKMLDKQLGIEGGILPNFDSADWQQILKDPNVQMVRARKFIALSYLSYLSGKANEALGKNLLATNQYEKAATISRKFLGPEDRITISYAKKYEYMLQKAQKQVKEQEKKQKPKSPPKEIIQTNDAVSPKARFIKGQKREELNMILKEYHSEIAAEISSIQKEAQQEAKDTTMKPRSPSPNLQNERQNLLDSKLNSLEKFGLLRVGNLKKRQNSATIRSASLNMSALRLPNDQQSTKVNTRVISSNQNESAYENNDLMVFDFSTPNTTMGPLQSRAVNFRIGTPSRNMSLMYPSDPSGQLPQREFSTPIPTPMQKTNLTATMNKSHTQDTLQTGKRATPLTLGPETGNFMSNANLPKIPKKNMANSSEIEAMTLADNQKEETQPLHRSSQFRGSTVLMMASRPSSAATNVSKRNKNSVSTFQSNGVFPMKIKIRESVSKQDPQNTELFFKFNEDHVKLDDKMQARPRSASFFGMKAANKSEIDLKLPLDQVLGGRKFSDVKMDFMSNQIDQITKPNKSRTIIDASLLESQIKNRVLDLSLSSASDLEEIIDETQGNENQLKFKFKSSKIIDSLVNNHPSSTTHKRKVSQQLSSYLKEGAKKDLQAYQDQKDNSPRKISILRRQESGFDAHADGKDVLVTPGFDHNKNLLQVTRTDTREPSNSRRNHTADIRISVQAPHNPSNFKNKPINTLADFRLIETKAARKIQRYYRSYKKWGNKKLERKLSIMPFFDGPENPLDMLMKELVSAPYKLSIDTTALNPLASLRVMDTASGPEKSAANATSGNQGTGQLHMENQASPLKSSLYSFDLTDFYRQKFSKSVDFIRTKELELEDEMLSLHSDKDLDSITKLQDENSNILSFNRGAALTRSTTVPLKQLLKHHKSDLIKTGLMKLNTSEIKYYKNMLGLTEFWKVSFIGLEEEGNKYRVHMRLKNDFASFDFSNTIKYKTAELSMFYTTIWPLVLEAIISETDLLTEKEFLATTKMDTIVILSGIRAHERKSRKLSKEEEAKIRLLLCHITARAEKELIFYRSKLNHALLKKSRFPNGDIIKKNRDFLKVQKIKYYRALHALATHMAMHNIMHELADQAQRWTLPAQTVSDMRTLEQESLQSIHPHNSPKSQTSATSQRSLGIALVSPLIFHQSSKQAGSLINLPDDLVKNPLAPAFYRKRSLINHSEQPSKGKTKSKIKRKERNRLQTTNETPQSMGFAAQVRDQKKHLQEFQKRSDTKSFTHYPSPNQYAHQSNLGTLGTEIMLEDLSLFPSSSTLLNPFLPGEMVLQGVMKQLNEFVLFTLKAEYSEDAYEVINMKKSSFELICEAERVGTEWISRIPIRLLFISENVFNSFVSFDQKGFLINGGFSSLQKKILLHFLRNNLTIQNSRIEMNKNPVNKDFKEVSVPAFASLCEFHKFMQDNALEQTYIFDAYEMFVFRRGQVISAATTRVKEVNKETPHQLRYSIRILNPKDPDYGNIAYGSDEPFAKSSAVQWLSLYNEIRCTFEKKYYFIIREPQKIVFIRLRFEKLNSLDEVVQVCLYQTQSQLCDYATIRDRQTIEKIIIILQMKGSSMLREKQMLGTLSYYKTLVGNKIAINVKASLGRFNEKADLLHSNIAQILLASQQERLPEYSLTVDKVFTKANIACLGDCYVTATVYKIKEFSGYSDVVCIKFDIQPFVSKTKLYKFLINSNDLQFFLDTEYEAVDKSDHLRVVFLVISRLWLKRQYLYRSLEIPISNHSSLPNSTRSYSLRSTFETKLEQLKDKEVTSFGRFLESKIQENVPIIQKLRKINGIYFIITVKKHSILNYWAITLYNPRTCRNYITAFYQSDLVSLNLRFLKQMLPEYLRKLEKDPQAMQNYANFCVSCQAMMIEDKQAPQKQFQQLISFQELPESAEDETKKFLETMAEDFLLEAPSTRNGKALQEKGLHPIVMRQRSNYVELKFWENVVNKISVERTVHGISILKVSEFRGVLREYVYRDIVRMSKTEEALVEIFLEHGRHKFEIEKQLEPIPDININEYIFFMRVTSIHSMHTYNNKLNFEQAIKLYLGDKRIVQKPLFKKKKLNLATVGLIGNYMVYKTKQMSAGLPQSPTNAGQINEFTNNNTVAPLPYFGLKLNCNSKIQMTIDEEHLFMNKFLIYRSILSLVPLQMVAFVYHEKKESFTAYIYDNYVSWVLKKKIQMNEVKAFIPYASDILRLGLYQELGNRILKAFKNPLIVHSYINSKTEQTAKA